eukprot:1747505-Ditylum_brightwellii.AAC.1
MGIDITVAGNPPLKSPFEEQTKANKTSLRNLEIKKWRESSHSNKVKYIDEKTLTYAEDNQTNIRKVSTNEAGAIII